MKSLTVDVLTANVIMIALSWDVMSCSSEGRAPTVFSIKAEIFFEISVNFHQITRNCIREGSQPYSKRITPTKLRSTQI